MTTPDIAGVMAAAMNAENDRRRLAAQRPGHGAPLPIAQSPAGAGVGISDVNMPAVGLGFSVPPTVPQALTASYVVPSYADDMVGGVGFQGGRSEPAVRHVHNLGADGLFIEDYSGPRPSPVTVVSAPGARRPGLLARAAAGVRRLLDRQ